MERKKINVLKYISTFFIDICLGRKVFWPVIYTKTVFFFPSIFTQICFNKVSFQLQQTRPIIYFLISLSNVKGKNEKEAGRLPKYLNFLLKANISFQFSFYENLWKVL